MGSVLVVCVSTEAAVGFLCPGPQLSHHRGHLILFTVLERHFLNS